MAAVHALAVMLLIATYTPCITSISNSDRDVLLAQFLTGLRDVDRNGDGMVSIRGYLGRHPNEFGEHPEDELYGLFAQVAIACINVAVGHVVCLTIIVGRLFLRFKLFTTVKFKPRCVGIWARWWSC